MIFVMFSRRIKKVFAPSLLIVGVTIALWSATYVHTAKTAVSSKKGDALATGDLCAVDDSGSTQDSGPTNIEENEARQLFIGCTGFLE